MLGLAFKPNTDDMRDSPSLDIARCLIARGATVRAHDPVAVGRARREYPDQGITCMETAEATADESDDLILVTEWPEYLDLCWEQIARLMRTALILDGRNCLDRDRLTRAGFRYLAMGR